MREGEGWGPVCLAHIDDGPSPPLIINANGDDDDHVKFLVWCILWGERELNWDKQGH